MKRELWKKQNIFKICFTMSMLIMLFLLPVAPFMPVGAREALGARLWPRAGLWMCFTAAAAFYPIGVRVAGKRPARWFLPVIPYVILILLGVCFAFECQRDLPPDLGRGPLSTEWLLSSAGGFTAFLLAAEGALRIKADPEALGRRNRLYFGKSFAFFTRDRGTWLKSQQGCGMILWCVALWLLYLSHSSFFVPKMVLKCLAALMFSWLVLFAFGRNGLEEEKTQSNNML